MKTTPKSTVYDSPKTLDELSDQIFMLLDANLEDSLVEQRARRILNITRRRGIRFHYPARDCPECAVCLHLSLMSAAESFPQEGGLLQ